MAEVPTVRVDSLHAACDRQGVVQGVYRGCIGCV